MRALRRIVFAVVLAAVPHSVAAQPAPAALAPAPPALATRVTAFFSAWKDRDLAAMYEFYCAPYREKTPRTEYLKLSRLLRFPILEFALRGVEVEGDKTTVVIHLKNDSAPMPTGIVETDTRQVWLQAGGTWCRESEVLLLPFPGQR